MAGRASGSWHGKPSSRSTCRSSWASPSSRPSPSCLAIFSQTSWRPCSIPEFADNNARTKHARTKLEGVKPMLKGLLKTTTAALALGAIVGATPSRADDTPVQGGSIIVTYKDDMATLDPAIGYDWQNWSMINSIFSRLVDYKPGTTELAPSLADSYTVSPDGLTYTFKLNPNAKFSNGRKVVAADVKYSIERAVNPKTQGPGAGFFHSIKGADAV